VDFRLSAFPPYKAAIFAKAAGDFTTARIEFGKWFGCRARCGWRANDLRPLVQSGRC
jgi:hypothetical protein